MDPEEPIFLIQNKEYTKLFWHPEFGWTEFERARQFTPDEKATFGRMPYAGRWRHYKDVHVEQMPTAFELWPDDGVDDEYGT